MKPIRPPHLARLRRRVEALDAPVVQLWAWPGSGQQAVLDALVAEGGDVAQPLSIEDLAEEASLRRAVTRAVKGSAPWLVLPAVPAPPRWAAETVASLLPAGRRLLFAAPERRPSSPLATAYVGPREHLLTAEEAAALWAEVTGRTPSPPLLAAAMAASDGWFRPLLVLAEAAAEGRGLEDAALTAIPGVESFLRHEVLAGLPPGKRAAVRWLALARSADDELWRRQWDAEQRATLARLRDDWGLLVPDAEGGERLPAPLGAYLAAGAWREPQAFEVALALAETERGRGRPAAALRLLVGVAERSSDARTRLAPPSPRGRGQGAVGRADSPRAAGARGRTRSGDGVAPESDSPEPDSPEAVRAALRDLVGEAAGELLATAPLSLLAAAIDHLAGEESPELELVRAVVHGLDAPAPRRSSAGEALGGGGVTALDRVVRQAEKTDAALAAMARTAAILLGLAGLRQLTAASGDGGVEPAGESPPSALPGALEPLTVLAAALAAAPVSGGTAREEDDEPEGEDDEPSDRSEVPALAAALAALAPPPAVEAPDLLGGDPVARGTAFRPDPVLGARRPDRRLTAAAALAAAGLSRLARRRPALGTALRRRSDLAPVWRDRLETPEPAEPVARGYELDLFGEGRVRRREPGGARELSWPLKRALKVLSFLATAPGWRALRTDLEEQLWPGAEPAKLRRNFHPTLSHLRRSLEEDLAEPWPPPLLLEGGFYRLNPALAWRVDAAELERLALEGRRSHECERHARAVHCWEAVRDLYRGPLLAGWDDPWIAARREHYQRLWLESLRGLGESYLRAGRLDEAMDALRTVLIHDPLQERVHVALMEVYARQGRRDLVHRQHERLVEQYTREIGEPPAEATEAYQRLMA